MLHDFLDLLSYTNPLAGWRLLLSPEFRPWAALIAGVFGVAMGSFLTMATYRLPLDEPIGMKRSHCTSCAHHLKLIDLIPMLSWASTRGRCRYCKTRVSIRYPLTELATALGTAFMVWHVGVTWEALALSGLWWCIVAIVITDLEHTIILDEVQIAVALFGIVYAFALNRDAEIVVGGALAGGLIGLGLKYGFIYFRNKDGLGLGDVKFLAVAGIWLGSIANFVPFLFISGLLGIISGLTWRAFGLDERFPFGPALAFALLLCVLCPDAANGFWKLYGLLH